MGSQAVVHVTECPVGGVSRAIELAVNASPELHHVVMAPKGSVRTERFGAEYVPLPDGPIARVRELRRLVDDVDPAFVHAHSSWAGVYARVGVRSTPVLYQPHCYAFADVTKPRALRGAFWLAERLMATRTAAVAALTPHEERQARRLGVRRVHRVTNAATLSRREVVRSDGAPSGAMTVAMVGRIAPQKDPAFFAGIAEVFKDDPSLKFLWIGGADENSAEVAALECAHVEVTGWLPTVELGKRLAGVDVYLHTAAYEGFPISLLDACELGIPSLVRDIPQLEGCGLPMFTNVDEAAIMIRALASDHGARAALAERSRALGKRHSIGAHDASVRALYAMHNHPVGRLARVIA